jgi:hypothetical protein
MATSLKSIIPALARVLREKPDTLYERQRALVREGLLESLPGHGPGSGVRATPESVAMLVIGLLATLSLSDAGPRAREIAAASIKPALRCRLTGAKTFKDALARILADYTLARRVSVIQVVVTHGYAELEFKGGKSRFGGATSAKQGLRIEIAIDSDTVHPLAKTVADLLAKAAPK